MSKTDLMKQIDALVEEKTFSGDALKGIVELRDKAEDLEKALERSQNSFSAMLKQSNDMEIKNAKLNDQIAELKDEIAEAKRKEERFNELECRSKVAEAKSETFSECFNMVFRNTTIRETVLNEKTIPGGNDQYGNWQPDRVDTETTETTKTEE